MAAGWNVIDKSPDPQTTQWNVKAVEPDAEPPMSIPQQLLGNAEIAGAGVGNIIPGAINAVSDIVHRLGGNSNSEPLVPTIPVGEAGKTLVRQLGNEPAVKAALGAAHSADTAIGNVSPTLQDVIHQTGSVAGDVANIAPVAGAVKAGVSGAVEAAANAAGKGTDWFDAGLRTGGAHPIARQVAGESGQEALVGHNAQVGNTIAATEAGHDATAPISYESLAEARQAPNSVYNRVAHDLPEGPLDETAQAGVRSAGAPAGGRMSAGTPQAQQAIGSLKAQLLDPERTFTGDQQINEVRGLRQEGFANAGSDDVSNQQLGKAQLDMARAIEGHIGRNIPAGGSVSLAQFQDARTALAKNYTVQGALRGGDVDQSALGLIHRNNPTELTGGLKTLAEFAEGPGKDVVGVPDRYNPPSALKDAAGVINFHRPVQSTLQGMPGVGSMARRFLTGSTADAIDQAQAAFPGRGPNQFSPLPGLTPPPGRAGRDMSQLGLGDLSQGPGPAPFTLEQGANPNPTSPGGRPGDISLADLLSHGVEQRPPQGLSAGPMGAPQGEGMTFRGSPDVVGAQPIQSQPFNPSREPVQLGDRFAQPEDAWFKAPGDLASIGSQGRVGGLMTPTRTTQPQLGTSAGVPEGIATRVAPKPRGKTTDYVSTNGRPPLRQGIDPADALYAEQARQDAAAAARNPAGIRLPLRQGTDPAESLFAAQARQDVLGNNASGESSASLEAQSRLAQEKAAGMKPVIVDPEGGETPLLHDVTAVDRNPPKGHLIVDASTGKLINSGGMAPRVAQALLARWKTLRSAQGYLGDELTQ